jgi:hypothetical protein
MTDFIYKYLPIYSASFGGRSGARRSRCVIKAPSVAKDGLCSALFQKYLPIYSASFSGKAPSVAKDGLCSALRIYI